MSTSTEKHAGGLQPAFCLAAAFACGVVAALVTGAPPVACLAAFALAAVAAAALLLARRDRLSTAALVLSVACAGAYELALTDVMPADSVAVVLASPAAPPRGAVLRFDGLVLARTGQSSYGGAKVFRYFLRLDAVEIAGRRRAVSGTVLVDSPDEVPYGSVVSGWAFFSLPPAATSPGQFDYGKYLANEGISCLARADVAGALTVVSHPGRFAFGRAFAAVRRVLLGKMDALGLNREGVIPAVLLGDRSSLPAATTDAFVRSGTMHLLSISGLHLVIVAGFFLWLLRLFGVPPATSSVVTLVVAACYTLVVGPQPPVVRSAIMLGLFCVAVIVDRPTTALSIVSVTALVMLVFSPRQICDVGFQMSFVAVLGLFHLGVPLGRFLAARVSRLRVPLSGLLSETANLFGISIGAGAVVAPLGLYHFGVVSFVSPFANLLLIPTTSVMLIAGFIAAGLSFISAPLASLFALSASGAETVLVWLAALFARVPFAYCYVTAPLWLMVAMYAWLIAVAAASPPRRLANLFVFGLAAANVLAWSYLLPSRQRPGELIAVDNPRAAALVVVEDGRAIVFLSRAANADSARTVLCPLLLSRGISGIALLVETAGADARIRDVLAERFALWKVVRQRKFLGALTVDGVTAPPDAADLVGPGDVLTAPGGVTIAFHAPKPINFLGPAEPWYEGLVCDMAIAGRRAVIVLDSTDGCVSVVRGRLAPTPDVLCIVNQAASSEMIELLSSELAPKALVAVPSTEASSRACLSVTLADPPVVRRLQP